MAKDENNKGSKEVTAGSMDDASARSKASGGGMVRPDGAKIPSVGGVGPNGGNSPILSVEHSGRGNVVPAKSGRGNGGSPIGSSPIPAVARVRRGNGKPAIGSPIGSSLIPTDGRGSRGNGKPVTGNPMGNSLIPTDGRGSRGNGKPATGSTIGSSPIQTVDRGGHGNGKRETVDNDPRTVKDASASPSTNKKGKTTPVGNTKTKNDGKPK